jgi:hypothetical protein
MVAEVQQSYRLKVRVGGAEFEAEGPESTVKGDYDLFLCALKYAPESSEKPAQNGNHKRSEAGSIEQNTWDRFYVMEGEEHVSLNILPPSENPNADAIVLLLYGYLNLRKVDAVPATSLLAMAKKSGLRIDRIDRNLPDEYNRYVSKGGTRKGARYGLNNQGRLYAQKLLEAEAER